MAARIPILRSIPTMAEHSGRASRNIAALGFRGLWPLTRDAFRRAVGAKAGECWTLEPSDSWTDEMLPWDVADSRPRNGTSHNDPPRTLPAGSGEGVLWGGSIRSLTLLAGTPYWPAQSGQGVLALEDEGMSSDELFAYLTASRWSGAFDQCSAVVRTLLTSEVQYSRILRPRCCNQERGALAHPHSRRTRFRAYRTEAHHSDRSAFGG
jgi:hypothetical protein